MNPRKKILICEKPTKILKTHCSRPPFVRHNVQRILDGPNPEPKANFFHFYPNNISNSVHLSPNHLGAPPSLGRGRDGHDVAAAIAANAALRATSDSRSRPASPPHCPCSVIGSSRDVFPRSRAARRAVLPPRARARLRSSSLRRRRAKAKRDTAAQLRSMRARHTLRACHPSAMSWAERHLIILRPARRHARRRCFAPMPTCSSSQCYSGKQSQRATRPRPQHIKASIDS